MVKELGETFQNIIDSLVEAGQKLLCHDTTVRGLIFVCNRFCNFVLNRFLKSLLYYDISQVWSKNTSTMQGGLTGPKLLEGDCWEKGGDFFQGVQFSHKNKLKSEIFNDKKSL